MIIKVQIVLTSQYNFSYSVYFFSHLFFKKIVRHAIKVLKEG